MVEKPAVMSLLVLINEPSSYTIHPQEPQPQLKAWLPHPTLWGKILFFALPSFAPIFSKMKAMIIYPGGTVSFNASLFVNLCLHVAGQAAVAGRGARFGLGLMML